MSLDAVWWNAMVAMAIGVGVVVLLYITSDDGK